MLKTKEEKKKIFRRVLVIGFFCVAGAVAAAVLFHVGQSNRPIEHHSSPQVLQSEAEAESRAKSEKPESQKTPGTGKETKEPQGSVNPGKEKKDHSSDSNGAISSVPSQSPDSKEAKTTEDSFKDESSNGEENSLPTEENSVPAAPKEESSTPTKPAEESSTPTKPSEESSTPVVPKEESSTPTTPTNPTTPTEESSTPVAPKEESSTPATPKEKSQPSTPAEPTNPAKPSEESSTPAEESSTPVTPPKEESSTTECQHVWQDITKTIHHEAVTELVPVYQMIEVVDVEEWDEVIGHDYYTLFSDGHTIHLSSYNSMSEYDDACGLYCVEHGVSYSVWDNPTYLHHDAVTHMEPSDEIIGYEEKTIDAWDEIVVVGRKCTKCGQVE